MEHRLENKWKHSGRFAVFLMRGQVAWFGHRKGDREKEIDLRGFEVKLTGLDDELVWWWQGTVSVVTG